MNYLNYLKHSIFIPDTYYRRYENDLEEGVVPDVIKRTALAALPFIALYRPAGFALSVGMGGCRLVSHLSSALHAQQKEQWSEAGSQLFLSSVAVAAIASTVFSFGLGMVVTTLVDASQALLQALESGFEGNYDKGFEELLQFLSSGLYLGFMATGVLEVILLSTVVQVGISLYQARQEIQKGRYIEGAAKVLLTGVRARQVMQYRQMIQKRDFLFSLKKYQELIARALRGKEVRHLVHHELADLQGKIDENQVTLSNQEHDYDFGSHFHGFGKGVVKGNNLSFRTVVIEGKEMTELQFKVNHVAREKLEKVVEDLRYLKGKEVQEILSFTGSHASQISVNRAGSFLDFLLQGGKEPISKITLEGLGSVSLGVASSDFFSSFWSDTGSFPNLYDRVVVHMEPNKTLYDFHELMSFLDLESALCASSGEDLERLKLGHLFRTFFPKEAFPLERSNAFFDLSIPELKEVMLEKAPRMQNIYDTYFSKMSAMEILPGRIRYQINGIADEVQALGISSLTTAVTGPQEDAVLFSRVASMLSMGMISTELRDTYEVNAEGLSKATDYLSGGADSVYLQLMPEEFLQDRAAFEDFSWYESRVRLQVSLKALESGSYQYTRGGAGNRFQDSDYPNRLNIIEFAQKLRQGMDNHSWCPFVGHEVMLKERLAPSYFTGMLIEDEATKQGLLNYLRNCNLIQKDFNGIEKILDVPVDEFMHVKKMTM